MCGADGSKASTIGPSEGELTTQLASSRSGPKPGQSKSAHSTRYLRNASLLSLNVLPVPQRRSWRNLYGLIRIDLIKCVVRLDPPRQQLPSRRQHQFKQLSGPRPLWLSAAHLDPSFYRWFPETENDSAGRGHRGRVALWWGAPNLLAGTDLRGLRDMWSRCATPTRECVFGRRACPT
jgi:hypothetical protein